MGDILFFIVFVGIYAFSAYLKVAKKRKDKALQEAQIRQEINETNQPATSISNTNTSANSNTAKKTGLFDLLKEIVEEAKTESTKTPSTKNSPTIKANSYRDLKEDNEYEDDEDDDEEYDENQRFYEAQESNHSSSKKTVPLWADGTYAEMSVSEHKEDDYGVNDNKLGDVSNLNSVENFVYDDGANTDEVVVHKDTQLEKAFKQQPSSEKLKEYFVWREILGPCKASKRAV